MVAPTTSPTLPVRLAGVARRPPRRRSPRRPVGPAAVAGVLDLPSLGVGGQGQHVDPAVLLLGQRDGAGQGAEAQVGADGDRVGGQRRPVGEVGGGVRVHGGADVAALDVQQRQCAPPPARSASTRSSTAMPCEPCISKNADCGLNTGTRSPRVSTMVRAQRSRPRAFTGSPHWRQQGGVRVDPGAQRTAGGHQAGESFSVAASSCSSSSSSRRSASRRAFRPVTRPGSGVDEAGVELEQAGPGVEQGLPVVDGHHPAHPDHRQVGARGQEADDLRGPARSAAHRTVPRPRRPARPRAGRRRPGTGWCWWRSARRRRSARPRRRPAPAPRRSGRGPA